MDKKLRAVILGILGMIGLSVSSYYLGRSSMKSDIEKKGIIHIEYLEGIKSAKLINYTTIHSNDNSTVKKMEKIATFYLNKDDYNLPDNFTKDYLSNKN